MDKWVKIGALWGVVSLLARSGIGLEGRLPETGAAYLVLFFPMEIYTTRS